MTQNIHKHRILILDFGSQYTQLVARRVREIGVYCELWAWDVSEEQIREFNPSGIILSGGPESTTEAGSPRAPDYVFNAGVPVLGVAFNGPPEPDSEATIARIGRVKRLGRLDRVEHLDAASLAAAFAAGFHVEDFR